MPTSTNISKYPQGMLDIIEAVCETEKPAQIAYPDTKVAKAERLKFYGLIRALKINQHSLADKATRLTLALGGQDRRNPNVLSISFPHDSDEDFYAAIAAKIQESHNG
jgi:hypothetical protein